MIPKYVKEVTIHTSQDRIAYWANVFRNEKTTTYLPNKEREYYIAWAAINLDLNLYTYIYPYEALVSYPNCQLLENCGIPKDMLILRYTFDPNLPHECYKASTIKQLALQEGLIPANNLNRIKPSDFKLINDAIKDTYELLTSQRNEITFYKYKHAPTNTETIITYEDIIDIPTSLCISYGTYNACIITTPIELAEHFSTYLDFVDFDKRPISATAIIKLKLICDQMNKEEYTILLQCITSISTKLESLDANEREWIRKYNSMQHQDALREAMNLSLTIGMYMRGWIGDSPNTYPMTGETSLRDEVIASNVSISMVALDEHLQAHPSIKNILMNLDLRSADTNYRGDFFWKKSHTPSCATLGDRFRLVNKGDMTDIDTCIRTSSNWIVGTIYYYGTMVGISYGFDIKNMRYIL